MDKRQFLQSIREGYSNPRSVNTLSSEYILSRLKVGDISLSDLKNIKFPQDMQLAVNKIIDARAISGILKSSKKMAEESNSFKNTKMETDEILNLLDSGTITQKDLKETNLYLLPPIQIAISTQVAKFKALVESIYRVDIKSRNSVKFQIEKLLRKGIINEIYLNNQYELKGRLDTIYEGSKYVEWITDATPYETDIARAMENISLNPETAELLGESQIQELVEKINSIEIKAPEINIEPVKKPHTNSFDEMEFLERLNRMDDEETGLADELYELGIHTKIRRREQEPSVFSKMFRNHKKHVKKIYGKDADKDSYEQGEEDKHVITNLFSIKQKENDRRRGAKYLTQVDKRLLENQIRVAMSKPKVSVNTKNFEESSKNTGFVSDPDSLSSYSDESDNALDRLSLKGSPMSGVSLSSPEEEAQEYVQTVERRPLARLGNLKRVASPGIEEGDYDVRIINNASKGSVAYTASNKRPKRKF